MIKLHIEKNVYLMPAEWSEITLEQYLNVISNIKHSDNTTELLDIVRLMGGIPKEVFNTVDIDSFVNDLLPALTWLKRPPSKIYSGDGITFNNKSYKINNSYDYFTIDDLITLDSYTSTDQAPLQMLPDTLKKILNTNDDLKHLPMDDVHSVLDIMNA